MDCTQNASNQSFLLHLLRLPTLNCREWSTSFVFCNKYKWLLPDAVAIRIRYARLDCGMNSIRYNSQVLSSVLAGSEEKKCCAIFLIRPSSGLGRRRQCRYMHMHKTMIVKQFARSFLFSLHCMRSKNVEECSRVSTLVGVRARAQNFQIPKTNTKAFVCRIFFFVRIRTLQQHLHPKNCGKCLMFFPIQLYNKIELLFLIMFPIKLFYFSAIFRSPAEPKWTRKINKKLRICASKKRFVHVLKWF